MNEWHDAEQRVERAQRHCENQRWAEALGELEAAIAIHPDHAGWHAQRGCLLEELGRTEEAVEAFERSLELEADEPEVVMALSVALSSLGRKARALRLLENLAGQHPEFEPAYCQRIRLLTELESHELAEQVFYLAQQINENCPDCFFHLGESLFARGMNERAMYCWSRVTELEPHYFGVHRRIADVHRAAGRLHDARGHLLCELRQDPGNTDLLLELAHLAMQMNDLESARGRFAHILDLEPTLSPAALGLARIKRMSSQFEEAAEYYELALEHDSSLGGESDVALELADVLFRVDRFAEAQSVLERTILRQPENVELRRMLGRCHLELERNSDAADCFRRCLAVDDNDQEARFLLGICLMRDRKYELALGLFRQLLLKHPNSASCLYHACLANLGLGDYSAARRQLKEAATRFPTNPAFAPLKRLCSRRRQMTRWFYRGRLSI